jgi:hypothetical protein
MPRFTKRGYCSAASPTPRDGCLDKCIGSDSQRHAILRVATQPHGEEKDTTWRGKHGCPLVNVTKDDLDPVGDEDLEIVRREIYTDNA